MNTYINYFDIYKGLYILNTWYELPIIFHQNQLPQFLKCTQCNFKCVIFKSRVSSLCQQNVFRFNVYYQIRTISPFHLFVVNKRVLSYIKCINFVRFISNVESYNLDLIAPKAQYMRIIHRYPIIILTKLVNSI